MTRNIGLAMLALAAASPAMAQTVHYPEPRGFSCPGDAKVWVNMQTGVYHFRGERYYGSTKQGQYMCERQARAAGDRPTKSGQ